MRLEEKIAVVTGGGSGIGEGICLCMAREGAHVVVSDLNLTFAQKVAEKISALGRNAIAIETDVRKALDCEKLTEMSLEKMQGIDILVCSAGVPGYSTKTYSEGVSWIENISEDDWNLTIDTNLKGVFLCNRAITPYFRQRKERKNHQYRFCRCTQGSDWIPHYSASKAGVLS